MTKAEPPRHQRGAPSVRRRLNGSPNRSAANSKLHCYRMLGSVHEAEDLAQETYLRAWRSFGSFDGRGSFRAWLYRIATNACLDALASRRGMRRVLPDQQAACRLVARMPGALRQPRSRGSSLTRIRNLDGIVDEAAESGDALCVARGRAARFRRRYSTTAAASARCAFAARRSGLVGRAKHPNLVGGSIASVNSALQRARETLARRYPDGRPEAPSQPNSAQQKLLSRYARAWEAHDLDGFVALLKQEATFTMPPWRQWYAGRDAIGAFVALAWSSVGELRLAPTAANGQPAFAVYARTGVEPGWAAHALQVLDLDNEAVSTLTVFVRPLGPRLFPAFGLPLTLPDAARAG